MCIRKKILWVLLSLAIILPAVHARAQRQDDPSGPAPGINQLDSPDDPQDGRWDGRKGGDWGGEFGRGGWNRGGRMGRRGFGREGREFMLARLVQNPTLRERLGITPEQAAKIRQQTFDYRKASIRGRADLQIKRLELRELLAADNPDRSAIDRKLEEISAARLAQEKSAIDYRLAMRGVLTPEQRQKLEQMRGEFGRPSPGGERRGPQGRRPNRPQQGAPSAPNPPSD